MSKHVKHETPTERLDRLIWELRIIDRPWSIPRHHATDRRWDEHKALMEEFQTFPQLFVTGAVIDPKDLWDRNMEAVRWEIENPLFGKAFQ